MIRSENGDLFGHDGVAGEGADHCTRGRVRSKSSMNSKSRNPTPRGSSRLIVLYHEDATFDAAIGFPSGEADRGRKVRPVRRSKAFTLVELLTVIAIVAVLATLLLTALGSATKKSRQARCTSNLHQIALALNMYLDDYERRSTGLQPLMFHKYVANSDVLLCPEDKTGNWGGLVNGSFGGSLTYVTALTPNETAAPVAAEPASEPRFSYLHPLPWDDEAWTYLMKGGSGAGLAVCQLHGLGKANLDSPSIRDFEGLILRARRDGAVVRRKIFWEPEFNRTPASADVTAGFSAPPIATGNSYPWPLFTDEPAP